MGIHWRGGGGREGGGRKGWRGRGEWEGEEDETVKKEGKRKMLERGKIGRYF